ncbi:MAG: hypothetical protein P1P83_10175 [Bacteroidales bacterium]|nr:hypothetical protein [Bacteroidales bacterium]MDT8374356.1 hypothetical protein [Bacteroidales bacterium]
MSGIKIRLFFLITATMLFLTACNSDKNEVIPDITVDFTVFASNPEFFDLFYAPSTSALLSSAHRHLGLGTGGFDGNGVIIYNTGFQGFEYYAYDRTCPHCYVTEAASVAVNIDGVFAICPRCTTNYSLAQTGQPYSGPGQYYLKNYRTAFSGNSVRVWNRK